MYPDDDNGDSGAGAGAGKPRLAVNMEGLIPIVLLVIVVIASLNYFGVVDIPFLPKQGKYVRILVIGEPSVETRLVLDSFESENWLTYHVRASQSFRSTTMEELGQYDVIMLDQTREADKSVPRLLGESIEGWVRRGGKLIVVGNSGTRRLSTTGVGYADDVLGWKGTFGDIMPMECKLDKLELSTCVNPVYTRGYIFRTDYSHPIMEGIPRAPLSDDVPPYELAMFDVMATGTIVAHLQVLPSKMTYPAIIEKKVFPTGKVIYFNYNPGTSEGILESTIEYLT
jgi:hypothetical protein